MPVIKPRTRGRQFVRHRTQLDRQNHETLYAYAAFIGEDTQYVLNELIDTVLARDKEFIRWRAEHPHSFAPGPASQPNRTAVQRSRSDGRETSAQAATAPRTMGGPTGA